MKCPPAAYCVAPALPLNFGNGTLPRYSFDDGLYERNSAGADCAYAPSANRSTRDASVECDAQRVPRAPGREPAYVMSCACTVEVLKRFPLAAMSRDPSSYDQTFPSKS